MCDDLKLGYMGHVLVVDLSSETVESVPLERELADLFIGGRPLATALLLRELMSKSDQYDNPVGDIDPLSEDNSLVFCTSPFTGTTVPTASRTHLAFKSPLTNGIGSTNSGGKWGVEFKKTGFDALVIKGKASRPLVLWIDQKGARLEDPPSTDSDDVEDITDAIEAASDPNQKVKVMTVGAAGRRLSPISCIMNDRGRAFGRGGSGAVFGSKNLYAIAVSGSHEVSTHNPDGLKPGSISGSVYKARVKLRLGKMTKTAKQFGILSSMGTNGLMGMLAQHDGLLHKNFKDNQHAQSDLDKIQGEAFLDHPSIKVKQGACHQCPIGCTRVSQIQDEQGEITSSGEGPEFETVALLGANLAIHDPVAITEANYLCNRYGFDPISIGGTIGALMEIYEIVDGKDESERTDEERLLFEEVAEFVSLHGAPIFGNTRSLIPLIEAAAKNKGIGKAIATGASRLSNRYGHPEASMTVKDLELPAYDPRATWTQALSYMICARGGCHLEGGYSAPLAFCAGYGEFPGNKIEGAAIVVRAVCFQNYIFDMLGVCAFAGFSVSLDEFAKMLGDVTGDVFTASDLERIAHRCLTVERHFNHKCGFTKEDDWLPSRFFNDPISVRGQELCCDEDTFARLRGEFYDSMGWNEDGLPTRQTLDESGLGSFLKGGGFEIPA